MIWKVYSNFKWIINKKIQIKEEKKIDGEKNNYLWGWRLWKTII